MESTKIKPLDVLSESQLSEIRKKNDSSHDKDFLTVVYIF